jgi:dihydroneopterin aldolase/2-amino-4-hydroxy-6-hydroxymethyldihydropteridine diphosphokinase
MLGRAVIIGGISTFYETQPIGRTGDPLYYNGIIKIETVLSPFILKYKILRKIEESLCRKRLKDKYAPRTIDLDILVYGDLSIHGKFLDIPDPDILIRPYLGAALGELDSGLYFSEWGRSAREIAEGFQGIRLKTLKKFTERLREEYFYGRQENRKARYGASD